MMMRLLSVCLERKQKMSEKGATDDKLYGIFAE